MNSYLYLFLFHHPYPLSASSLFLSLHILGVKVEYDLSDNAGNQKCFQFLTPHPQILGYLLIHSELC